MSLPNSLRAFRHRRFRIFFIGQGTSQIGTWLQLIATSWLVQKLSGSALQLGIAAFALQIPFLVLAPFAGVIVDRLDRRRVLLTTNSIAASQSMVLLWLVATGNVEVWHMVAGNLVLGLTNAFDAPARHSLIVQLVGGRQDLPNAIALNSTVMNSARLVGPMIGGAVIAAFGEKWGFALNSLSYVAMLTALSMLGPAPPQGVRDEGNLWRRLAAGIRFAYGFLPTRYALILLATVSFTAHPYQPMMPWFAANVYGGGSFTLGLLLSAGGCGAVSGMLYLATRASIRGLFRVIPVCAGTAGAALLAFAYCRTLWLAVLLIYVLGMGLMLVAASVNTVLQTLVPDELRARVASLYVMSFLGVAPLGALSAGAIGERFGPPVSLAIGGALAMIAAAIFASRLALMRRALRPVYEKLGIIGPVAVARADTEG